MLSPCKLFLFELLNWTSLPRLPDLPTSASFEEIGSCKKKKKKPALTYLPVDPIGIPLAEQASVLIPPDGWSPQLGGVHLPEVIILIGIGGTADVVGAGVWSIRLGFPCYSGPFLGGIFGGSLSFATIDFSPPTWWRGPPRSPW